jgi:hypothetical protein
MAGSQQAEVSVVSRFKAWDQRNAQKANPFNFKDVEQGKVAGSEESQVKLSPIMDGWARPKSNHVLLAGAWQNPHIDLNKSPNWNLYRKLAGKAASQKIDEVDNLLNQIPDKIGDAISNQVQSQIDALIPFKDQLQSAGEQANGQIEKKKAEENEKARKAIEEQQASVRSKREGAEADVKSSEQELAKAKTVDRPRVQMLIKKEKDKPSPDEKELKRLDNESRQIEKRILEFEQTKIPKLKKGVESLKKAEADLQRSLERVK